MEIFRRKPKGQSHGQQNPFIKANSGGPVSRAMRKLFSRRGNVSSAGSADKGQKTMKELTMQALYGKKSQCPLAGSRNGLQGNWTENDFIQQSAKVKALTRGLQKGG